jgi:hypothetical protein
MTARVSLRAALRKAEDLLALRARLDVVRLRPREQMMADGMCERATASFLSERGWVWDAVQREWRPPSDR